MFDDKSESIDPIELPCVDVRGKLRDINLVGEIDDDFNRSSSIESSEAISHFINEAAFLAQSASLSSFFTSCDELVWLVSELLKFRLLRLADNFENDRLAGLPVVSNATGITISSRHESSAAPTLPDDTGLDSADDLSVTFTTSLMAWSLYIDALKLDENVPLSPAPRKPFLLLLPCGLGNDRRTRPEILQNADSRSYGVA